MTKRWGLAVIVTTLSLLSACAMESPPSEENVDDPANLGVAQSELVNDRSPCGTGTSAKLACLAADGELQEGEHWIQESILGSTFAGSFRWLNRQKGEIVPVITGTAFVTSESTLLLDDKDPFCWGIQ